MAECFADTELFRSKARHATQRARDLDIKRAQYKLGLTARSVGNHRDSLCLPAGNHATSSIKPHRCSRVAKRTRLARGILSTSADMPMIVSVGTAQQLRKPSIAPVLCAQRDSFEEVLVDRMEWRPEFLNAFLQINSILQALKAEKEGLEAQLRQPSCVQPLGGHDLYTELAEELSWHGVAVSAQASPDKAAAAKTLTAQDVLDATSPSGCISKTRNTALQLERKVAAEVRRRRHHEKQLVILKAKAEREPAAKQAKPVALPRKTAMQVERKIAAEVRRRRHQEAQLQALRSRVARQGRAAQRAKDEAEAADIASLVREAAKHCEVEVQMQQEALLCQEVEGDLLPDTSSHQGSSMPAVAKSAQAAGEGHLLDEAPSTTSPCVKEGLRDTGLEDAWEILLEHDLGKAVDDEPASEGWNVIG